MTTTVVGKISGEDVDGLGNEQLVSWETAHMTAMGA